MSRCGKKTTRRVVAVPIVLALVLVATGAVAQEPLVINEVLADPASDWDGDGTVDFKGDEWIEIRNVGPDPVDLSAYFLRDDTGDEPHLRLSGTLAPDAVKVFYGSEAVAWQAANGLSTTGFSLNNGGDIVRLLREIPGSTELELMYVIHYEDHMAEDDRSNGWNLGVFDWLLFDALSPYSGTLEPGGTGCAPTPGLPNECGLVPNESTSFGAVKSLYR